MTLPLDSGQIGQPSPASVLVSEGDLVARYWDRVRLFALRRLRESSIAEDVAQETLRAVTEALRSGRVADLGALPGYVFRTAQHLCLQRMRSSGREARALERFGNQPTPDEHAQDPLVALIGEEQRASVRRAMGDLPPADRDLLTLIYFDEADSTAAAGRLGVTPEAFRVRKHRALKRLGELLAKAL